MSVWKLANPHTNIYCRSFKTSKKVFERISNSNTFTIEDEFDKSIRVVCNNTRRKLAEYCTEFGYRKFKYIKSEQRIINGLEV